MRQRVVRGSALGLLGILLSVSSFALADPLTIKTQQGKSHGKLINEGKVRAFLGIPYAAPPVGESALEGSTAGRSVEGRARCDEVWRTLYAGQCFSRYGFPGRGAPARIVFI